MMRRLLLWILLGVTLALACNLPLTPVPTLSVPSAMETIVAPGPTYPLPFPTATREATPVPTPTPWPTLPAMQPSPTPDGFCLRAAAGYPRLDITIPDGTVVAPGAAFVKVWRLKNAGTCAWRQGFAVVWIGGDRMGPTRIPLEVIVPPGGTIDVVALLTAPGSPGRYTAYWKLQSDQGQLFGLGENGRDPFWVEIVVPAPTTAAPTSTPSPTATVSATPSPSPTATPSPTP